MKRFQYIAALLSFLITVSFITVCFAGERNDTPNVNHLADRYQQAKFFFNQLKTPGSLGLSRDNWLKGASNFRHIYLAEPKSDLAPACLFMLGRIYFDMYKTFGKGIDLGESISYYRDVHALFPRDRLADDALYAVGTILLEEVRDPKRAAKAFDTIVSSYENGDMHTLAETKLKILSKDYDIPLPPAMVGSSQLMQLTNVLPVKYWSSNNYTRVVIKTSGPVIYHEKLLEKINNRPRRLYIDFQNSYIEPRFRSPVPIEDGLLKRVRTGQYSTDTVRVVLDIESIASYKIFSLPDPFRVVIDVRGQGREEPPAVAITPLVQPAPPTIAPQQIKQARVAQDQTTQNTSAKEPSVEVQADIDVHAAPAPAQEQPPSPNQQVVILSDHKKITPDEYAAAKEKKTKRISLAQQLGLRIKKIVIDPGHGGKDPGAIAYGLKEKDIVLNVAKKLARHLRQDMHTEVIMTRTTDVFLPLEERTAIANSNDADLFISLHINAHPSNRIKGFETYYLNLSTNDEAMRVAARENATSTHQMSDLQDILSDIMQNSKINESSRLAAQVHTAISTTLCLPPYDLKDMGVKQAPFYVLIGAEMPAILVEIGFISNQDDAKLLTNEQFLDSMAGEITQGIEQYENVNTAQL